MILLVVLKHSCNTRTPRWECFWRRTKVNNLSLRSGDSAAGKISHVSAKKFARRFVFLNIYRAKAQRRKANPSKRGSALRLCVRNLPSVRHFWCKAWAQGLRSLRTAKETRQYATDDIGSKRMKLASRPGLRLALKTSATRLRLCRKQQSRMGTTWANSRRPGCAYFFDHCKEFDLPDGRQQRREAS
jgi:hypothetical protein